MGDMEYVVIARGHTIIAAYGDKSLATDRQLKKLFRKDAPTAEQKILAGKLCSFRTTPGDVFACVSTQTVDRQRHLARLDAISRRWIAQFGHLSVGATSHGLDSLFEENVISLLRNPQPEIADSIDIGHPTERPHDTEAAPSRTKPGEPGMSVCECSFISWWIVSILIVLLVALLRILRFCGLRLQRCLH
jgi:hypothetical protein